MSGNITTSLVTLASALEAGPATYSTAKPPEPLPTPTVAELQAFGSQPSGGLQNTGANAPINPEPILQQLMQAEQAKRRLEVTLKLLTVQFNVDRRVNAVVA